MHVCFSFSFSLKWLVADEGRGTLSNCLTSMAKPSSGGGTGDDEPSLEDLLDTSDCDAEPLTPRPGVEDSELTDNDQIKQENNGDGDDSGHNGDVSEGGLVEIDTPMFDRLSNLLSHRKYGVRITLIAGFLLMSVAGSLYNFSSYAPAMKRMLHYSQTQISLVATCSNIGAYVTHSALHI